jgi:acetoin utilization deacetylase AcuC-like enzyme
MGFCLFNNVALGALHLLRAHGLRRVLIVDWDVHHGNGTQDIFYARPGVFYLSIHQGDHYPGTGDPGETGEGEGRGWTRNLPVEAGTPDAGFVERLREGLQAAVAFCRPEFVLVSAGFDAHRDDPLGGLMVTETGFAELTRMVRGVADAHCGGRLVSALEGGYHPDALARSVEAHLAVLMEGEDG